jgi:diguanylate cyclase (GGDEF)-like protein
MKRNEEIFIDPLSNLYNRRYLDFWIYHEIKRAERFSSKFSLLLIDIDYFKQINDKYGHLEGDMIIREFSEFIIRNIREVDIPIRYGGDEFIVIFPVTDKESLKIIVERIYKNLEVTEFKGIKITISSGIAEFPTDGETWEELFSYADKGLYKAKNHGKNRCEEADYNDIGEIQIPSPLFVGREEEFNFITNSIENENKFNIVTGEIGIGKTRFIKEIAAFYKNNIYLKGASFSSFKYIAFHSVRQILKDFYIEYNDLFYDCFNKLNNNYKNEIKNIIPFISWQAKKEYHSVDRYAFYYAIVEFFSHMSYNKNVFIMFDDLQWIDQETLDLIHILINSKISNLRIFGTYRKNDNKAEHVDNFLSTLGRERIYNEIILSPLSKEETKILLSYILNSYPPDEMSEYIYSNSGGNPFYIEEIINNLYKNNSLSWESEKGWALSSFDIKPPGTIADIINTKFNTLDRIAKDILYYISVIGRPVQIESLVYLLNKNEGELIDSIDKLIEMHLLEGKDISFYYFREGIALRSIYSSIKENQKKHMHRNVAKMLEYKYKSIINDYIEEIVFHAIKSGDNELIKKYIESAAKKLKKIHMYHDAIDLYKRAIDICKIRNKKIELLEDLTSIYNTIGNYTESINLINIYIRDKNYSDYIGKLYFLNANNLLENYQFKESEKMFHMALKHTRDQDMENSINVNLAWLYANNMKYDKASLICFKLLTYKNLSNITKGDIYNTLGAIFSIRNDTKAEIYYLKALKYRKTTGDKRRIAAVLTNLAIVYSENGQYRKAINNYKKALSVFEDASYIKGIVIVLLDLSSSISNSIGEKESIRLLKEAEKKAIIINNKNILTKIYSSMSFKYLHLNKKDTMLEYTDLVMKYAKSFSDYSTLARSYFCIFEYYLYTNPKISEKHYKRIVNYYNKYKLEELKEDILDMKYDLLLYSGQYKDYIKIEKLVKKSIKYASNKMYLCDFYLHLAIINSLKGNKNESIMIFNKAGKTIPKENKFMNANLHFCKGIAYKFLQEYENSKDEFKSARKLYNSLDAYFHVNKVDRYLDELKTKSR